MAASSHQPGWVPSCPLPAVVPGTTQTVLNHRATPCFPWALRWRWQREWHGFISWILKVLMNHQLSLACSCMPRNAYVSLNEGVQWAAPQCISYEQGPLLNQVKGLTSAPAVWCVLFLESITQVWQGPSCSGAACTCKETVPVTSDVQLWAPQQGPANHALTQSFEGFWSLLWSCSQRWV